jgi:hypothetical protein
MEEKVINEKGVIREFDTVIYPVDIVVAVGDVEEEVNKLYSPENDAYNYIGRPEEYGATTYRICNKETNDVKVLIWIYSIREWRSSFIAHEAGHATMEIFKHIGAGIDYDNQEPFCYLLGTVSRFINKTCHEYVEYLEKNHPKEQEIKFTTE